MPRRYSIWAEVMRAKNVSICLLAAVLSWPSAAAAAPDALPLVAACGSGGQIQYMEAAPENAPPYWREQVASQYPTSMCVFMKRPSAQAEAGRTMILPTSPQEDALGTVLASIVSKREQEAPKQSEAPAVPPQALPITAAPAPEAAPKAAPRIPVTAGTVVPPETVSAAPVVAAPPPAVPATPEIVSAPPDKKVQDTLSAAVPDVPRADEADLKAPVPAPKPNGNGGFAAQVLSVAGDDAGRARGEWHKIVRRVPFLKEYEPSFVRADVGGTSYTRIRIAALGFSEAGRLCERMKAESLGCLVVRNELGK